jgi:hypothetical protein
MIAFRSSTRPMVLLTIATITTAMLLASCSSGNQQPASPGLGLWLTKNIVKNHRWTIRLSSSNTGKRERCSCSLFQKVITTLYQQLRLLRPTFPGFELGNRDIPSSREEHDVKA